MITTNEIGRRLTTSNCCQVNLNENDVLFCHHCCCLGGTGSCDHYGAQLVGNRIFQRLIQQNVPIFESLLLVAAAVSKVRNGDGGGGVGVSKRRTAILMKRRKLRRQQVYLAKSIIEGMKKTCGTRFFHYIHHHHQSTKKEMRSAVTTTNTTTTTKEEATFVEMTNDEMIQITLHSLLSSVVDVVTML